MMTIDQLFNYFRLTCAEDTWEEDDDTIVSICHIFSPKDLFQLNFSFIWLRNNEGYALFDFDNTPSPTHAEALKKVCDELFGKANIANTYTVDNKEQLEAWVLNVLSSMENSKTFLTLIEDAMLEEMGN